MRPPRAAGLAALLAFGLYLATRSQHYTADSLLYALAIESGDAGSLFDPSHLLLHPLGWSFYQLWRLAGWTGRSMLPLQVLNALGGALCVGLVFALARRLAASRRIAWLVAAGFAASGGIWLLSVEAEFVTIPLALQLLVLWGLLAAGPRRAGRPGYAVLVGLGTALATLAYLTGLFLVPAALVAFLLQERLPWPVRRRQAVLLTGTVLLLSLPAFLWMWAGWAGGDAARLAALVGGGGVYGQLAWTNLPWGGYAFLRSLVLYPNLAMNDSTRAYLAQASAWERLLFAGTYTAVLILAAAPVGLALSRWRRLWRAHRRALGILLTWAILHAAFAIYWVPGDVSFWVQVLAAWWLLIALVVGSFLQDAQPEEFSLPAVRPALGRAWLAAGCAGVALLLLANGTLLILPRHDLATNHRYHLATSLAVRTSPGDLVITADDDVTLLYIAYFARGQVAMVATEAASQPASLEAVSARVADVYARGGRAFVVDSALGRALGDALLGGRLASPALAWQRVVPLWQVDSQTVWELVP